MKFGARDAKFWDESHNKHNKHTHVLKLDYNKITNYLLIIVSFDSYKERLAIWAFVGWNVCRRGRFLRDESFFGNMLFSRGVALILSLLNINMVHQ